MSTKEIYQLYVYITKICLFINYICSEWVEWVQSKCVLWGPPFENRNRTDSSPKSTFLELTRLSLLHHHPLSPEIFRTFPLIISLDLSFHLLYEKPNFFPLKRTQIQSKRYKKKKKKKKKCSEWFSQIEASQWTSPLSLKLTPFTGFSTWTPSSVTH